LNFGNQKNDRTFYKKEKFETGKRKRKKEKKETQTDGQTVRQTNKSEIDRWTD
jgi:hypothetical protein